MWGIKKKKKKAIWVIFSLSLIQTDLEQNKKNQTRPSQKYKHTNSLHCNKTFLSHAINIVYIYIGLKVERKSGQVFIEHNL